jgi:conjugal transfer mating pair stabilization protein TraN
VNENATVLQSGNPRIAVERAATGHAAIERQPMSWLALFRKVLICFALFAMCAKSFADVTSALPGYAQGACMVIPQSKLCVDDSPCKTVDGKTVCLSSALAPLPAGALTIPQACWKYSYDYSCETTVDDTCGAYKADPTCGVISSSCQDRITETGLCSAWNYTYQCKTADAVTQQQMSCNNGLFKTDQFATPAAPASSFPKAAVAQEMMREAQIYSQQGREIFAGSLEQCRKGYGGIQNCCKSAQGAQSNAQITNAALGVAGDAIKYYGEKAISWASSYVYDAMFNESIWTEGMTAAFSSAGETGATAATTTGFSTSAFGFTYSASGSLAQGSGLFGADTELVSFDGGGYLAFNPYVFVAMVIIMIITSLASCSQPEQMLILHKGANLSTYKYEKCAKKFLGGCLQYVDIYCSFNSVLARIINDQGKPQLGLNTSDCTGFTTDQIGQLDFTRIDFSEFAATMLNTATSGLPTNIPANYSGVMDAAQAGSAQKTNPATPSYPGAKPLTPLNTTPSGPTGPADPSNPFNLSPPINPGP